jgi:cell division septum initiation protein DivIVA
MSYTPVELRHVRVGRSLLGYNRRTVEQVIEEVAASFEATWRERGELADKVDSLEKQLVELRKREELLAHTLVAAEQAASDVRERAKHEAEAIVTEAHNEGRAITRAAQADRERMLVEARRIETMLRAALSMFEDSAGVESAAIALATVREEGADWPREDTREFEPINLPPVIESAAEEEPGSPPVLRKLAGGDSRDFDWGE